MWVLDANILIRAVLGSRALFLLRKYAEQTDFLAPDTAFREAREHLPEILQRRNLPTLHSLGTLVQTVELETYAPFEAVARQRISRRAWRLRSH